MSKRAADHQISKDEYEAGEDDAEETTSGTWKEADPSVLAQRQFVKVKRKEPAAAKPSAMPTFNFGGAAEPANAAASPNKGAAAPATNAFAALVNKGNWECTSCLLSNKKDLKKCAACEEPSPLLSAEEKAALKNGSNGGSPPASGGFTFGGAVPASTGTQFSFGAPAGATFSFGAPAAAGPTFGASTGTALTFGGVVAGGVASWAQGSADGEKEGALGTAATFGSKSEGPKEEFKDKKPEASGEESDQLLLKMATKVYMLKPVEPAEGEEPAEEAKAGATKFVESGTGDLHINQYESEGKKKCRMVLRAEKTQRLVLNAPIFHGMTKELQGEKFVRFTSMDLNGSLAVFLLKFKSKSDAMAVYNMMEKCITSVISESPAK